MSVRKCTRGNDDVYNGLCGKETSTVPCQYLVYGPTQILVKAYLQSLEYRSIDVNVQYKPVFFNHCNFLF